MTSDLASDMWFINAMVFAVLGTLILLLTGIPLLGIGVILMLIAESCWVYSLLCRCGVIYKGVRKK